jgi:hypothetical protein
MSLQIAALDLEGRQHEFSLDTIPDYCPICHHGIEPRDIERARKCGHLFIARYAQTPMSRACRLSECVPLDLPDMEYAEEIAALSTNFCEIFNQAQKAEATGWILVAGPAYRKALEFLIKDYACALHEGAAEKIKKMELGPCVQEYMKNAMVKETAQRAAWLGNDETHYLRIWEGKDLQDLKDLLPWW